MLLHRSPHRPSATHLRTLAIALVATLAFGPGVARAQADVDRALSAPPLVQVTEESDDASAVLDDAALPTVDVGVAESPSAASAHDAAGDRGEGLLRADSDVVRLSLRDAGLRPPSARLRLLEAELASLPTQVSANAATWIGQILVEFGVTALGCSTFGFLTLPQGSERDGYALLAISTILILPVGAVTWAIGAIVDGHRERSLQKRRRSLVAEIRREVAFDPSW